jgi:hypothetical protein
MMSLVTSVGAKAQGARETDVFEVPGMVGRFCVHVILQIKVVLSNGVSA